MNKGFTLIELLVVVSIMGLMGTASVGGYRQMQRGMEESGVVDSVSQFVKLASERAQIDRKPTAVYFWNEMLREETEDEPAVIVGRAVAVRTRGRISRKDGNCLIDEFGDLEQFEEDGSGYAKASDKSLPMRLYLMDDVLTGGELRYSVVQTNPRTRSGAKDGGQTEIYVSSNPLTDNRQRGKIIQFGYYVDGSGTASVGEWKVGSLYGLEFQSIELPHGYVFESQVPSSMSTPTKYVTTLSFDADAGNASGAAIGSSTITIYAMRPGQSGSVTAQKVRSTTAPNARLK